MEVCKRKIPLKIVFELKGFPINLHPYGKLKSI